MKSKSSPVKFGVVLPLFFCLAQIVSAAVSVGDLRCEYLENPLGIDEVSPRLSWIVTSTRRGEMQTAYRVLVASSSKLLDQDKGDLWDTGKVASDESAQIAYGGSPLSSRRRCFWKVQAWDRDGKTSSWGPMSQWEMGLLQPSDWNAKWITAEAPAPPDTGALVIRRASYEATEGPGGTNVTDLLAAQVKDNRLSLTANNANLGGDPALKKVKRLRVDWELAGKSFTTEVNEGDTLTLPAAEPPARRYLRKSFELNGPIQRAVLYVSALGLYEIHLNGQRVGDHVLAPDWTDYRKRVRYQAYDVTKFLQPGANAMATLLGNGWFSGRIGNGGNRYFGTVPALIAQLEVTREDGKVERVTTDESWKSFQGPIITSDFMLGEDYDARLEVKGWDKPGLDERAWVPASLRTEKSPVLEAQVMPPVRQFSQLIPKSIAEPQPGHWVFDLGQNMVGVVRLKVTAPAGTTITLRHAEMLNPDGTIYITNLRRATSTDHYTCAGGGVEVWQPRFTFHGFRYVELSGLPDKPKPDAVTGIVITTDTPETGEFTCSDPQINQLQSNIQWGQRGNYVSIPTDCPQRDERLGWMGDAQVFVRTATYNADVASFFTKWLVDVDDGQSAAGSFGDVSPNTMGGNGVPGWGDAGVICPWTIYDAYGDKRILERHLPAMIKWVDYLQLHSDGLIRDRERGNDYGDWLSIGASTPKDLIGTAYFAYSTSLLAKSCAALGRTADAAKYDQLFQNIKTAFLKRYVSEDGHIQGSTQCDYALALKFNLLPEELRSKAAQYLEDDVKSKNWHLSTGFLGVGYLLPVLTQAGKAGTAYRLLLQDTFPSWLFSVKQGATTIWERWDGWTPEKGFQDPGMNSFNHYSLGSCGEYLFGGIGGIRPASPGYKTIAIEPVIGPGLTWAKTRYNSIHGPIATDWKVDGHKLTLEVRVPANTQATIHVPAKDAAAVTESGATSQQAEGVKFLRQEKNSAVFAVGSGTYRFVSEMSE